MSKTNQSKQGIGRTGKGSRHSSSKGARGGEGILAKSATLTGNWYLVAVEESVEHIMAGVFRQQVYHLLTEGIHLHNKNTGNKRPLSGGCHVTEVWSSHDLLLLLPLLQSDGESEEKRQHGIQVSSMAIWEQPEIKQTHNCKCNM